MADTPEDTGNEHDNPVLSTPPQWQPHSGSDHPYGRDDAYHSDAPSTHQSRPASPSLGPDSLEMPPLPPFRDQFSTPTLPPSSPLYLQSVSTPPNLEHGSHEDIPRDSRVVLAQRLSNLLDEISQGHVEDETIHTLHTKVDELESALQRRDKSSKTRGDTQDGTNPSWVLPPTDSLLPSDVSSLASPKRSSPAAVAQVNLDRQANNSSKAGSPALKLTVAQSEKIAAEVQNLREGMEIFMANLRERQEETEASLTPCLVFRIVC